MSIVKLNVGGIKYTTLESTINKYDSFLSSLISGRHSVITDDDGYIFIDRDGEIFKYILNFFRDEEGFYDVLEHLTESSKTQLFNESYYYTIEPLIKLLDKSFRQYESFPIGVAESDDNYDIKELRTLVKCCTSRYGSWAVGFYSPNNETLEKIFNIFEKNGAHNYYMLCDSLKKPGFNFFTRNELSSVLIDMSYNKYGYKKIYKYGKKENSDTDVRYFSNLHITLDVKNSELFIPTDGNLLNFSNKFIRMLSGDIIINDYSLWGRFPKLNVIDPSGYHNYKMYGAIRHTIKENLKS